MKDLSQYLPEYKSLPIIAGPTASGKSDIAMHLAEKTGGEIVSCDSMQIYKGLDIGTAKPTKEDQAAVPHHMIDIVDPNVSYSVSDYSSDAIREIEDILSRGRLPIICGGTGQYVSALFNGTKFGEDSDSESVINELYERFDSEGIDGIYEELSKVDPEAAAKIHPNNTRRVIRAYAVYLDSGVTFTEKNKRSHSEGPLYPFMIFCPDMPRDILYDRINRRVDIMVEHGLVEEARWLLTNYEKTGATALQAIGYKELFPYIKNERDLDSCIYEIKLNSRHYAKRQLSWFRYMSKNDIDLSKCDKSMVEILGQLEKSLKFGP